jgi:hypothetical protein
MSIKSTPPQPVRLLPRNEPAPSRIARQQFRKSYPDDTESHEFHVGRIRRDAVIGHEPPPAHDNNAHHADPAEPHPQPQCETSPGPSLASTPATLSTRIARACARDEQANLRNARLAAIIAQFCNGPGILDSGGWQLQIGIDPALLPATRLHLTLSSCRLSLRFETAEPDSRRVILDNSKELQQRLSTLLPAQIEVDIVCW